MKPGMKFDHVGIPTVAFEVDDLLDALVDQLRPDL